MPSTRLISSRLKNFQLMVMPFWRRTSRIHLAVWYAYGHIGSKWKSTVLVSGRSLIATCWQVDERIVASGPDATERYREPSGPMVRRISGTPGR